MGGIQLDNVCYTDCVPCAMYYDYMTKIILVLKWDWNEINIILTVYQFILTFLSSGDNINLHVI